ncbi:MAG: M13 family metallopeptidase [Elusimicrobia bacterium]|nr:M13 family metallopeptidase [Elusimicrobiota bacterium]
MNLALVLLLSLSPRAAKAQSTAGSADSNWNVIVDTAVNPCDDFYRYACDKWDAANPIPGDYSRWGRFGKLADDNRNELREILNTASRKAAAGTKNPNVQKIGDFYAACMDTAAIEDAGLKPLDPALNRIAAMTTKAELTPELARLQEIGVNAVFSFSSEIDDKHAQRQIAAIDQGGFNLPDRDYYLKPDFAAQRKAYVAHIQKMFTLLGESDAQAQADAAVVMRLETDLARISMGRVERRVPANLYHIETLRALEKEDPSIDWPAFFKTADAPPFKTVNVMDAGFYKKLNALIEKTPLSDWKTYLRWQLVTAAAPMLPQAFVMENFDFFNKDLSGQKEIKPRWKRCVIMTDAILGEALGKEYVDKDFPGQSKERALAMVRSEEATFAQDMKSLDWMSAKTKLKALHKLSLIQNKIGYPDKWRDYSKLVIKRDDALGDLARGQAFEFHREVNKIGKPTDRNEWEMTPPTVNAYYDPQENNINFPAGILQPPYFDQHACLAQNLGGIGAVIGHEMTHGFDDQGHQYDGHGNRRNWWTKADATAFKARTQCLVNEYSGFTAVDDPDNPGHPIKVNGKLTLGENTADNGGVRIAYMTLQKDLKADPGLSCNEPGWSDAQVFFLSYAQNWCNNDQPEDAKQLAIADPHSPGKDRVNGVVSNMPEFREAFNCPAQAPMVRIPACRVW